MPTVLSEINTWAMTSVDMDPQNCKRVDYTSGLIEPTMPDNAASKWRETCANLRDLYAKLGSHEAMRPNLDQTFSTPANSKNKIYFMWDFTGRTLATLYAVPCKLSGMTAAQKAQWEDCQSRVGFGASLLTDQMPGMLNMMVEGTYPGQKGNHPEIGEEVLVAARRCL